MQKKYIGQSNMVKTICQNTCKWQILCEHKLCGKPCKGKYCSVHNYRLKSVKRPPVPCIKCGRGVLCDYRICNMCGGKKVKSKLERKGKSAKKKFDNVLQELKTAPPKLKLKPENEKIRQRMEKGWGNVHKELEELPYCEDEERHRKATICNQHENCELEGKCECCNMPITPRDSSKYRWKENWVLEITNLHSSFLDDIEEEQEEDNKFVIEPYVNIKQLYFQEFGRILTEEIQLTEKIQALPPELREKIYKEFVKIKLNERELQGWDEIMSAIELSTYCKYHEQITNPILHFGLEFNRISFCPLCLKKGRKHKLNYNFELLSPVRY